MSRKRGNEEGSITKRKDGRWMAHYTVHTPKGPKRKVLYGRTRADVSAKLARALADREDGLIFDAEGLTVKEYLGRWLKHSVEALYVLAVTTGLRQGELLALKWDDVDLERGVLRVRRTLTRVKGRVSLGEPKTSKSRRSVKLTASAAATLREHLSCQLEEIDHVGSLYEDGGLVFATEKGTPLNPTNLRQRSFAPLLKRAKLRQIRFHDLRHTCATLLLSRNVNPKIVSEMLGHASISITLDTYLHVLPNMQDSTAQALEDALR